jgi:cytochrome c oxidase assembly factor CtaG
MGMEATLRALFTSWDWRFEVILILGGLGSIYVVGWRRLRHRGSPRNAGGGDLALYLTGLGLLGLALLSPIDTFTPLLFFMHMIQHELLMMLAPPLLLLANPFPIMLWGLPKRLRRGVGRLLIRSASLRRVLWTLTLLPLAWLVYVVTLWGWHHPAAYEATLRYDLVHDFEHLTFFGAGLLFWWPVVNPAPRLHGRVAYGWRILYVLLAAGQNTMLAALLSLSERVLYPYYLGVPRLWGLTAVDDQAIGGGIMWISGGMMYVITILVLVASLLNEEERLTRQREARDRERGDAGRARTSQGEHRRLQSSWRAQQVHRRRCHEEDFQGPGCT